MSEPRLERRGERLIPGEVCRYMVSITVTAYLLVKLAKLRRSG